MFKFSFGSRVSVTSLLIFQLGVTATASETPLTLAA
ncbi:MAG: hypothetical protein K0S45_4225, partial [Nitrospira sp.]|nr:hypothetical protein [Nitrospira sp.]